MLRAVLFDYGLTLVTFAFPREALLDMLGQVRPWLGPAAPEPATLLDEVLGRIEDELPDYGEDEVQYLDFYERAWRRVGLFPDRDTLYRILDLEQRCWDRAVRLAPDAVATLERVRGRGLRTAVASNAPFPPEMMHRQVRENGIAGLVDAVVFSSEVGRRKPAPELYRAALDRLGVAPEEALSVGDRQVEDYAGPRRLGMRAVLCTALARQPPGDGVPTIARLGELEAYLDRLEQPG